MLSIHHITKTYGIHAVLQDITFSISGAERIGLIGPNGCGKTTLLRILCGEEKPDSGTVVATRPDLHIGYLPQGFHLDPSLTFHETCTTASGHNNFPGPTEELESAFAEAAAALLDRPADQVLQRRYDELASRISTCASGEQCGMLASLGLGHIPPATPVGTLSGGQKTRLMLARLLLDAPNLLLLDEPTNHLDIQMLEWLETWLERFPGAALIVSHDRTFLDHTVRRILEIDPLRAGLHAYTGNYTSYNEQHQAELEQQWAAYLDQQAQISRMKQDIARTKAQAERTEREASSIRIGGSDYKMKGYKSYQQGIAKKVAKKAKSRERKLERLLASDEMVDRPRLAWRMKLDLAPPAHLSSNVLVAQGLAIGYPGNTALLQDLNLQVHAGQHIAFIGPNGSGKTTLLRTIAGQLEPVAGSIRLGPSEKLGYMSQEQELLDPARSPVEIIQSISTMNQTRVRSFLHAFLFTGQAPLRPCGEMSYGERTRLELAVLVAMDCTFLLLDEPINHLDIPSRERFEQALGGFKGTILAVLHDRTFIKHFATDTWSLEAGRIRQAPS